MGRTVRTQVYLTIRQHRALRQAAARQGTSMTDLLRRMVDERLAGGPGAVVDKEAVLAFVGLGASGHKTTSSRHDEVLDEAFRDGALR
jgi:cytochrome P450